MKPTGARFVRSSCVPAVRLAAVLTASPVNADPTVYDPGAVE